MIFRAIVDSFRKLNPRAMVKNPVMFVVEVGAVLTSVQLAWNASHHAGQIQLWFADHIVAVVYRAVCQFCGS